MPESPEVTLMVNELSSRFAGSILKNIKVLSGRYKRHGSPQGYNEFIKTLPTKINGIYNKGKFIWIIFSNGFALLMSLGMEGMFVFDCHKHCNILFNTSKGDFYMEDQRNFGTLNFYSDGKTIVDTKISELGVDPLNFPQGGVNEFITRLRKTKSKKPIADLLLDQKYMSGVGNYIRSEGLYLAKINPQRTLNNLSDNDLNIYIMDYLILLSIVMMFRKKMDFIHIIFLYILVKKIHMIMMLFH